MEIIKKQQKTPLLIGDNVEQKRAEIKQYFLNSWQTYDALFSLINSDDAYFLRPEPLRHPLIFYFGHTATFYVNKLILGKFIKQRINPRLEAICAVGVDEMSWDDLNSEHYDWPRVDEVREYRQQVAALMLQLIDEMPLSLPITQDSLAWVVLMGIEHERIHIETSSVIMRMLDLQYLGGNSEQYQAWQTCTQTAEAPTNTFIAVPEQAITLGKPESDHTYGWDNEYGVQKVQVDAFSAAKYLVSNQEFLEFINAGGYQKPDFWSEEGQKWLAYTKATMPRFWFQKNNEYWQRNLLNEMPLPLNWPVEINYLEAKAFCAWKSQQNDEYIRMPTEAEWQCLRNTIDEDLPTWQQAPGNINLEYYASSCPVDSFQQNEFYDVIGNVWQWTESSIDGFEGFTVHPLYDDFSTPTFDGKHNLIKGGSWISTGNEAIKHSRYAFRRHFMQHAGFRYIRSENKAIPTIAVNPYEIESEICQQLQCHYGQSPLIKLLPNNYQQQLALQIKTLINEYHINTDKLLDLGCSVGRTSFELANVFQHIDALDFSARYIRHGVQLQNNKRVRYITKNEGEIVDFHEISLAQLALPSGQNILFSQGDASNLKAVFTGYDVVLAQQILESNHNPKAFLTTIHQRIKNKGLLVLVSDYHFDEQLTVKDNWLGGFKENGENVTAFHGIERLLEQHFNLLTQDELIKPLCENQRNFKLFNLHITVWQKK